MPFKLTNVKFCQVPPNTYFTYKGNPRWVKSTWVERIKDPHNAYRDDYGATPRGQDAVWWKLFNQDDIVQVRVLEV